MNTPQDYRGNRPRSTLELNAWHENNEDSIALDSLMPIVDSHHHIFGTKNNEHFYRLQDFGNDISGGHNVIGTLWVEAYGQGWRTDGPPEFRSVGEVEGIAKAIEVTVKSAHGTCKVAAGMVSNVDLMLGENVTPVLEAHIEAANGRLSGIRHHAMHDDGKIGSYVIGSRPHLLEDPIFRRGVKCLSRFNLSFDALVYHPQISEVTDLADAFPNQQIVLNHIGQILGAANFSSRRDEVFDEWKSSMQKLALRSNVRIKIGGLGMPMSGFGFESQLKPANSDLLAKAWQPYIDFSIEKFGAARCMFESNFPVDKQSCSYTDLWNAFKLITRAFSESEKRNLFYKTACQTYQLPELEVVGDSVRLT